MNAPDSREELTITECLALVKDDDSLAEHHIWQHYHARLLRLAKARMCGQSDPLVDEEDIVLTAFHSLLSGIKDGRFPDLRDRHDLWQLLIMLTERAAVQQFRYESAKKRAGTVRALPRGEELEQVLEQKTDSRFVDCFCENVEARLQQLHEDVQRRIAVMRLQGYTVQEIADQLACSKARVERKLRLIRAVWLDSIA